MATRMSNLDRLQQFVREKQHGYVELTIRNETVELLVVTYRTFKRSPRFGPEAKILYSAWGKSINGVIRKAVKHFKLGGNGK